VVALCGWCSPPFAKVQRIWYYTFFFVCIKAYSNRQCIEQPQKSPLDSISNTTENVPQAPDLGWLSSLSQSIHHGSNSIDNTMVEVGVLSISMMKMKITFKRSFQGAPKKEKSPQSNIITFP